MGIWSCLGQNIEEVRTSLRSGRSGIGVDEERLEYGYRSALTGLVPRPNLKKVLDRRVRTGMSEEAAFIETSAKLNAFRWGITDPEEATRQFHDFMEERVAFLDSAWINGMDYRTITAKTIGDYRFYCTKPDTVCIDLPSPEELGLEEGTFWIREDNGARFDPETLITEDITLVAVPKESETGV